MAALLVLLVLLPAAAYAVPVVRPEDVTTLSELSGDYGGYVMLRGEGNYNSRLSFRLQFKGFYVVSRRILSGLLSQGSRIPAGDFIADFYTIVPKSAVLQIYGSVIDGHSFEGPGRNDCWEERYKLLYTTEVQTPSRDQLEQMIKEKGGAGAEIAPILTWPVAGASPFSPCRRCTV